MKYQFGSRVRFSETGPDGFLTIPALFDYFQDGCTFQAEQMGMGVLELKKRNRIWVTAAWQVDIARRPRLGEEILVSAIPYKIRGYVGMKNMLMETPEGEWLAWANSCWGYLNYTTGAPERLTAEDLSGFEPEPKLDMEYASRRILDPDNWEKLAPFTVLRRHLDANGHVNNCQYIHMACDYLPESISGLSGKEAAASPDAKGCLQDKNGWVCRIRAEYRMQGHVGDTFYPAAAQKDNTFHTAFFDEKGEAYAVVEFLGKQR